MYRDQSSLTISDLTDSDADEYRCKTTWWSRDFPGTTLTVVDPRMQVIRSGQELVCHSSCFPLHHLSFVWFMNGQEVQGETSSYYRKPVSPEASYSCSYQGHRLPEVYAPKSVSVSMSLTEIMEGSSVTLTCSCDANPPAKFRWYKNNQTLLHEDPRLILWSVQRSDSGKYHCVAENKLGEAASDYVFINVEYPPETSSVSVSPSAEVLEGSSVTLTCSSDANPAANYTWYKKDEDSPKASGPNWTISDFRAEHSGFYYCEAENRRGRLNSSLQLIEAETDSWKSAATAKTIIAVFLFVFIPAFLWIRKNRRVTEQQEKRAANRTQLNTSPDINSPSAETEAAEEQLELHYSSIHLSENQEECLYSNIRRNPKPRQRPEDNSVE
ncbi:B-cell receptor CD22-like [Oryzias latipes]|uniref:B-cell receptor CD22-like n=1 Tax=Oryzias latipes TaxID=8090 RepID=UPI000CE2759E|nr:B-cell receptor CD22-like [Oryzias latipes]